jgi:hypothetical protein
MCDVDYEKPPSRSYAGCLNPGDLYNFEKGGIDAK